MPKDVVWTTLNLQRYLDRELSNVKNGFNKRKEMKPVGNSKGLKQCIRRG